MNFKPVLVEKLVAGSLQLDSNNGKSIMLTAKAPSHLFDQIHEYKSYEKCINSNLETKFVKVSTPEGKTAKPAATPPVTPPADVTPPTDVLSEDAKLAQANADAEKAEEAKALEDAKMKLLSDKDAKSKELVKAEKELVKAAKVPNTDTTTLVAKIDSLKLEIAALDEKLK